MAVDISQFFHGMPSALQRAQQGVAFGQAMSDRAAAQRQAEVAAQQQAAMNKALTGFAQKENKTASDYIGIMTQFPQLADKFKAPLEAFNEEQRRVAMSDAQNVFAALEGGNTEIAMGLLERKKEAALNSGNQQEADMAEILMRQIEMNPEAAKTSAGLFLAAAMGPEEMESMVSTLTKRETERQERPLNIAKIKAETGLTTEQIDKTVAETDKLGKEVQKLALELDRAEDGTNYIKDPKDRLQMELAVGKEYYKRSAGFRESNRVYKNMLATVERAKEGETGAADMALVTQFMKMLDPGSVVRETEFANARDTAGLYGSLQNAVGKLKAGKFLTDKQRKEFTNLAEQYFNAAKEENEAMRMQTANIVNNSGLNPDNVFFDVPEPMQATPAEGAPKTLPSGRSEGAVRNQYLGGQ